MNIWFTADTHFGHKNIIRYCNRPFSSVEEMDESMIESWNEVVKTNDDDIVFHLGDFAFKNHEKYLSRLNGVKYLIRGNHDPKNVEDVHGWSGVSSLLETIMPDGTLLVMCHYAMRVWNRSHHGSLHIYGHSHGTLPGTSQSCDVGADCWNFRPIDIHMIRMRMATFEPQMGSTFENQRPTEITPVQC